MNTRTGRLPDGDTNIDNVHALTGAYVLNALDSPERAVVERHLAECDDCSAEVTSLRDAASALVAPDITDAPDALRTSVLARVRHVDQTDHMDHGIHGRRFTSGGSAATFVAHHRPARTWIRAAAAAAIFAGGVSLGSLTAGVDDPLGSTEAQAANLLTASDVGMADIPWGNSYVVFSVERGEVALMCHEISENPSGMVYQLWVEHHDGTVAPSITFTPDSDGNVVAVVEANVEDIARLMITREPAGGSNGPSGEPIAEMWMT